MARYAAVDIGSNSVRMLAAETNSGSGTRVLAQDREVTRLGAGVFSSGTISAEAMDLLCSVLARMADGYTRLDVLAVRAVATAAVRDASNQKTFIERASEALGAPVEIISGQEEARLIHLGVQSRWPHPDGRVLMIDVGGGSAEFIVGDRGEIASAISRPLGALRLTEVFLKHDPPTGVELHRMQQFIDEKFEPAVQCIGGHFDRVIATSATAAAIVSAVHRVPRPEREAAEGLCAELPDIRRFYAEAAARDLGGRRKMEGVGPRRAEIIVAGAAVFLRVLETLGLESMYYSTAGVRDGIVADLAARGVGREVARLSSEQARVAEEMCRKYNVPQKNVKKVAGFAAQLFDGLEGLHRLTPDTGRLLEGAAYLHDIGRFISDTAHHKHSAYVVANSDLPGFTDQERQLVAALCRYHRKSLPTQRHEPFRALSAEARRVLSLLIPLLRIAIALDTRKEQRVSAMECRVAGGEVKLLLSGDADFDLELWAAERAAEAFRQAYNMPLTIEKVRT